MLVGCDVFWEIEFVGRAEELNFFLMLLTCIRILQKKIIRKKNILKFIYQVGFIYQAIAQSFPGAAQ